MYWPHYFIEIEFPMTSLRSREGRKAPGKFFIYRPTGSESRPGDIERTGSDRVGTKTILTGFFHGWTGAFSVEPTRREEKDGRRMGRNQLVVNVELATLLKRKVGQPLPPMLTADPVISWTWGD